MERYICIHGHFYQPPRENPWLEAIELQDAAYPYHDWNERLTAQCYSPNAVSRILDSEHRIVHLVNNYTRISFNFGPTLMSWMRERASDVYRAIVDADQESQKKFAGHGSALAQPFNHVILPLANRRDRFTQIEWGIRDFERSFARRPEGLWLPEAAVDLETLDIMAELGIRFTVLAPTQAARIRPTGRDDWQDVAGGKIDSTRAYLQKLPSGRSISLFFFDPSISRAVVSEGLLTRGEFFAERLVGAFSDQRDWPQLVHISTDGEVYGQQHRYGDMALAYALHQIESTGVARLTNYGEFLERHPPTHEVEIVENSSATCPHGIERWRTDCGCNAGHEGWNQAWRTPLRQAFDWLRDELAPAFEQEGKKHLKDPWAARNDYIDVIQDRSAESIDRFLTKHALRELKPAETTSVLKLLEMQRHALLMYTSCGWFQDDLSSAECVQVLRYAARALQLAEALFRQEAETKKAREGEIPSGPIPVTGAAGSAGASPSPPPRKAWEDPFLARLAEAKSNLTSAADGQAIYEKSVRPAMITREKIGANYAVSSLFETYPKEVRIYCFSATAVDVHTFEAGKAKLAVGRARLKSEITKESAEVVYGVLHLGDHNVNAGVRLYPGDEAYQALARELPEAFRRGDFPEVIRLLDRHFEGSTYALQSLFRDEQRKILQRVLHTPLTEAEATYRRLYQQNQPTMRFLAALGVPLPRAFQSTAEFLVNTDLRWAMSENEPDLTRIRALLDEALLWNVTLDNAGLGYELKQTIGRMSGRLREEPGNLPLLTLLREVIDLSRSRTFDVGLWLVQNVYFHLMHAAFPDFLKQLEEGDAAALPWLEQFVLLGDTLGVQITDLKKKVAEAKTIPSVAAVVEEIYRKRKVPSATYRLQFNPSFTFRDARAIVSYLHQLGISDVYASPILRARAGSTHGYDISDHSQLNPDLGGETEFNHLSAALRAQRMGLILDVVPNHMGIGDPSNVWWMDVLENGPSSAYARFFDIDWQPVNPDLDNKVLLPILEDQYGQVLEKAKLKLSYDNGAFYLNYHAMRLPVAPKTYIPILNHRLDALTKSLGAEHQQVQELMSIVTALGHLPPQTESAPEKIAVRTREKEVIKRRIAALYSASPDVQAAIDTSVEQFNGANDDPHSFDPLDALLDSQAYRPAYWRVATEEINYRRFFDINELAAIRMELPEVFQATHQLPMQLLARGKATGLRIDHPDGLWDPTEYFRKLQDTYVLERVRTRLAKHRAAEGIDKDVAAAREAIQAAQPDGSPTSPLYVVAEKILIEDEPLPKQWAISGTTGYEFLNADLGVFIDSAREERFDQIYRRFVGNPPDFGKLVNSTKKMTMLVALASEINALSHQLDRISEKNRRYRDFTLNSLTHAIREIIACLSIYRTYITGPETVTLRDRRFVEEAVAEAKRLNPRTAGAIFDFIQDTLLLTNIKDFPEEDRPGLVHWVMKFQQVTGPVMAKAVEDTAFYIYNRFVALNEVGGNPRQFGVPVATFHQQNKARSERWPHSMLATSTHDTKRSEDVRARLAVLAEIPDEWEQAVERWSGLNADKKTRVEKKPAPDRNDEYLIYQTLVGAWPEGAPAGEELASFCARITAYLEKATKEAKVHTSWINANAPYDQAVRDFIARLLPDQADDAFSRDVAVLARRVAYFGHFVALGQALLKLTCPGVPDIYQGTELWDYSLVDPDNRRPVDYLARHRILDELQLRARKAGDNLLPLTNELVETSGDGRIKMLVMSRTLHFRRVHRALFADGSYEPLQTSGARREHVCAFARVRGDRAFIVAVPRLVVGLAAGAQRPPIGTETWQDTRLLLPEGYAGRVFHNLFTGEHVTACVHQSSPCLTMTDVLAHFPVALLELVAADDRHEKDARDTKPQAAGSSSV
jgi:(1->4)-alpha-D-glucan 1-alpha-D-glucosylmutase